jgi:hypothetical protein
MHQVYSQSEYWNRPCCLMTRAFLTHQYRDLLGGQQEHSEAYNCCNVVRNASSCGSSPCSLLMLSILSATKPTTVPCCWLLPNAATPSIDSESCLDATYTSCSIGALPIDVGISPDSEFDPRLLVDVPISSNQYQSVPISSNQYQSVPIPPVHATEIAVTTCSTATRAHTGTSGWLGRSNVECCRQLHSEQDHYAIVLLH